MTAPPLRLTPAQADEVAGLLDVCADDLYNGDRTNPPWAELAGRVLTVVDPIEAALEIRLRAVWNEEESDVCDEARRGAAVARSLRRLAGRIERETC